MGPKVPRMLNSWKLLGPIVLLATSSYWLTVFTLVSHNNLRNPLLRIGNSQNPARSEISTRGPRFILISKETRMKRTQQNGMQAKRQRKSKGFSGRSAPVYDRPRQPAGEMKYFDTYKTTTAVGVVTTTWPAGAMVDPTTTVNLGAAAVATPLSLFVPTVGSALNQRIGRSVLVRKIKIHGQITAAATGTNLASWEPYLPRRFVFCLSKTRRPTLPK